jgi:hypothetical protein
MASSVTMMTPSSTSTCLPHRPSKRRGANAGRTEQKAEQAHEDLTCPAGAGVATHTS